MTRDLVGAKAPRTLSHSDRCSLILSGWECTAGGGAVSAAFAARTEGFKSLPLYNGVLQALPKIAEIEIAT